MNRVRLALADGGEREAIYRMRHVVYAAELGQHAITAEERLSDPLDDYNEYVVAAENGEISGFVSLTPPGQDRYSVDKYFSREEIPFPFDDGLWEVRLLTVPPRSRGRALAFLLMYAAFRLAESRGGTRIVAIGRRELLGFYRKAGLRPLGPRDRSGQVVYELMTATVDRLRTVAADSTLFREALLCYSLTNDPYARFPGRRSQSPREPVNPSHQPEALGRHPGLQRALSQRSASPPGRGWDCSQWHGGRIPLRHLRYPEGLCLPCQPLDARGDVPERVNNPLSMCS